MRLNVRQLLRPLAIHVGVAALTIVTMTGLSTAFAPEALACNTYVSGYYRSDGTYVSGHSRSCRTARHGTTGRRRGTTTRTPARRGIGRRTRPRRATVAGAGAVETPRGAGCSAPSSATGAQYRTIRPSREPAVPDRRSTGRTAQTPCKRPNLFGTSRLRLSLADLLLAAIRARPSSVRGPVLLPPCIRHRRFPMTGMPRHGVP